MSKTTEVTTDEEPVEDAAATASTETESADEEPLGEAGTKALASLKEELKQAKKELADRRAAAGDQRGLDRLAQERKELEQLREFKAKAEGTEADYKASLEAQRVQEEALRTANTRIVNSELRAAAKGKLADPNDARLYIDVSSIEVDANGEVNSEALDKAITDLIARKPHLAAVKQNRFDGDADQGAKGKDSKPAQLSRDDLKGMSDQAIEEAKAAGQLDKILGIK